MDGLRERGWFGSVAKDKANAHEYCLPSVENMRHHDRTMGSERHAHLLPHELRLPLEARDGPLPVGQIPLELGHEGGAGAPILLESLRLLPERNQLPLSLVEQGAQVGDVLHRIRALHSHLGHLLEKIYAEIEHCCNLSITFTISIMSWTSVKVNMRVIEHCCKISITS